MLTVITQLFQTISAEHLARRWKRAPHAVTPSQAQRLADAPIGQPIRLLAVRSDHRVVHRLAELGLTPGVTLTVVQAAGGPLLVAVRGARVAIGRELAEQIEVASLH